MTNSIESRRDAWLKEFLAAGHDPVMDDDEDGAEVNWFASSGGGHNGPECKVCGWSCCHHCASFLDIPKCEGVEKKIRDTLELAAWHEKQAVKSREEADAMIKAVQEV